MQWVQLGALAQETPGDSPADCYTPSLRRPTAEESELLLIHEEPRKVQRTGHIRSCGQQHYRAPERYIGRCVWTVLKGGLLTIECNHKILASYALNINCLKAFPPDSRGVEPCDN